jgi:hypothetical protein
MPKMCNFVLHLCRFCRQSHGITAVTEKPGIRPIPRCVIDATATCYAACAWRVWIACIID